ncbi:regulatory protein, tetR family [Sinosporangium album]|uniref:Regulatory protein, tetR family n=1 Tax=Sinosporangium album TaxID=504805 RepID=A0A1G7UJ66_9ACTN|nr:TetR/AcrR family transcriptional regulator [Sinosporangium album]SDG47119.1 regulatory protein, tetR family [Sinosporangium album]
MARARPSDTRARIQAAALDLFTEKGIQQTSLREIADRLGVTKPALYYHFASRDDLVRSLIQPLVDDFETFITEQEAAAPVEPRALLAAYFDVQYRHRQLMLLVIRDVSVLSSHNLGAKIHEWRNRLLTLLIGPTPSLADLTRAIVAVGGLADCTIQLFDAPRDDLRTASVNAACAAFGI